MLETIYEHYGVRPTELMTIGQHKGFQYRNILYTIINVRNMEQEELTELHQMSQFLMTQGDRQVATLMANQQGTGVTETDDQRFIVCRCPIFNPVSSSNIGKELALFHQRGRMLPYEVEKCKRLGQWKSMWETRLDQMEKFWYSKVQEHPNHEMEKKFIESFPYYVGLTENAIQYLVDTEIDDLPRTIDTATICHHRFTAQTWGENYYYKLPIDWVFDHPSRDLAEYIRANYMKHNHRIHKQTIHEFLSEYETVSPLSSFAWRLLYARLLFPVHYFEVIEGYYSSRDKNVQHGYFKQLESILQHSNAYEQFLKQFYSFVGITATRYNIPELTWLSS
ncbi:spore coat putative kinase YutH [Metabacillus iocasae]|uniref:Spore coat protein YutH n=1 Tax=Priestia iocasae TaxID=2291674 RepID=A0ABS2QYQ3_9BACI|nr:spore coat protein YutH [Metabacillus iocasae]MBM7704601.1 spore coat protein YutH [Metabacillus iocasae]